MPGHTTRAEPRGWPRDGLLAVVVAIVVLGPVLLHRGYVLRGDMVFTPNQPWKGAWLGLDGRVPRFVPGDALLSGMGALLPGDVVQKLLLLVPLVVGGVGAGRLVRQHRAVPRAAAIVLFLWNPWVLERLAIGQWPVVVGYFLLPWVTLAAERLRADDGWRALPSLAVLLTLSAIFSPASGLVSVAVTVSVLLARPRVSRLSSALAVAVVANLPWVLPALVSGGSLHPARGQFTAFAPNGESSLGVVGSVLSLGGIWKTAVVPGERTSAVVVALSLVMVVIAVAGLARVDRQRVVGLGIAGAAAVLLALLSAVPSVANSLNDAATRVPAVGLLRDSHRFLGPLALALVPGIAASAEWILAQAGHGRELLGVVALLLVVAPVLCLPSLAWGMGGTWHPVAYPPEWFAVRQRLPDGPTVVLPWRGGYRGFAWNGRHAVLDPAPRFLPGEVLIDDRLVVDGHILTSEDVVLQAVGRAVKSDNVAARLHRLGVRSVLVEKGNGVPAPDLAPAEVLHDGPWLTLVDLGPVDRDLPGRPSEAARSAVVITDLAVMVLALGAIALALLPKVHALPEARCSVPPA